MPPGSIPGQCTGIIPEKYGIAGKVQERNRPYILLALHTKVFCYGTESVSSGTIDFLKEQKLEYKSFDEAFHWLMTDKDNDVYSFLYEFVS